MAKMMTKSQVAAHIAGKFELTKKQGTLILEELANLAGKEAKKNGFVFPGVGKLVVVNRKARMGRNPQTGEPIKIPAKRVLKFRIAKAMKELALKAR
jgi:DNA-binding protein HU-beta